MDLCRACLSTNTANVTTITENFIDCYNILTNLNVNLTDGLISHFCQTCVDTIMYFVDFRNKCISSDTILKNMLCEISILKQEINDVKVEFDCGNDINNTNENYCDDNYPDFDTSLDGIKNDDYEAVSGLKQRRSKRNQPKQIILNVSNSGEKPHGAANKHSLKKQLSKVKHIKKCQAKVKEKIKQELFCGLCNSSFADFSSLNFHLEEHKVDKCCGICQAECSHWPQLLGHRLQHVKGKKCYCHICHKICASVSSMEFHYLKNHYDGEFIGLQCSQCSRYYDTVNKLRKHVWSVHSMRNYTCDKCSKVLTTRKGIILHMLQHNNSTKLYECVDCDYKSSAASSLTAHKLRKHTTDKFSCKLCSQVFKKKEYIDRHKCTRVGQWMCAICGKQFNKSYKYSKHIESHQEVGRYRCERCPAAYKSRANLQVHRDRHDNNPSRQCEYCHRKFYAQSTLIKHRRIHTGEKPYVCKVCHKAFTGNHNLKVHMKVHGEYLVVKKVKEDALRVT